MTALAATARTAWLPGQSGRRILVESAGLLASPLVDLGHLWGLSGHEAWGV